MNDDRLPVASGRETWAWLRRQLGTMAALDWRLGLAGLLAVPSYVLALRWYLPRSAPVYARERAAVGARAQLLVESMQGVRTVHAYRLQQRHLHDLDRASVTARDLEVGVFTLFTRFVGPINRSEFVGLGAILAVGFWLVSAGAVTVGETAAAAGSAGARALEESALAATRGRTVLIVAHRLTQAASADRVVVLEHGRIVEQGPHAELVAAGGRYAELWRAWESRTPTATSVVRRGSSSACAAVTR